MALCIITKVDKERENIIAFKKDLILPKTKFEKDMSGTMTLAETINKIQDDLLLVSLISMFHTIATS